jgi:hypothetical protein
MIELQKHTGLYRVEEYGLALWLAEVQTMIQKGYEFDFVKNENYPVQIGTIYSAILVPTVKQEVIPEVPSVDAPKVAPSATLEVLPVVVSPTEVTTDVPKVDGRKRK